MTPKLNPKYKHYCNSCDCLGEIIINDVRADVFVCEDIVLARFSSRPDDYEAAHLQSLTMSSNVFLLAAFRLYLDKRETQNVPAGIMHSARPLQG